MSDYKDLGGCPCSTNGPCCDNPDTHTPEHDEPEDGEFCEECYGCECDTCGKVCYCEL